ncbi:MAG: hypothetical protein LWX56_13745 [Ignavibacteria bacterium]|nr:hypothetical protein [Ignavibacteria bacterium]
MKNSIVLVIAIFFCVWMNGGAQSKPVVGKAYDLKSASYLYSEITSIFPHDGKSSKMVTRYTDTDGRTFAERVIHLGNNRTCPDFTLNDFRSGYIEGAKNEADGKVRVYSRKSFNDPVEEKYLVIPKPYVIDGGLNFYIRDNLSALLRGEILCFNFVAPAKLDYYRFRVTRADTQKKIASNEIILKLQPDSFILRALVSPIFITYSLETKELLMYKGLSNINDNAGKSLIVSIDFTENYK